MKVHYDLEILPDDQGTLAKYNSDICKWHLFLSNITEEVFQLLSEFFALDYKWSLHFLTVDVTEVLEAPSQSIPATATDVVLKGVLALCVPCLRCGDVF